MGDIFQIVSLSRRSGTLQLTTPAESGEIVFRAGKVVAAYRTNANRSVGEGLLEASVVAPTTYQEMLTAQKAGTRGPDLFTAFNLPADGLQAALEGLLKRLIFGMFEWNEGTFSFVLEDTPDIWRGFVLEGLRVVLESGLNPQYLAIEGARIRDERTKEDTLESFLQRDQPQAQPKIGSANMQEIAKKLRSAAELDMGTDFDPPPNLPPILPDPGAEPPPANGEVIPFPADRLRPRPTLPAVDPSQPFSPPPPAPVVAAPPLAPPPPGAVAAPPLPSPGVVTVPSGMRPPDLAPLATPAALSAGAGSHRLLAVDDDPLVTRHIKAAFGNHFTDIITADTVKDALSVIEQDARNLVVATDLIIARSDGRGILGGIEILERVRQSSPDLPVVLFTDYQNEEAETRARSMGALAVLLKPRKAQVQAAPKDGKNPIAEFLDGLGQLLTPYFGEVGAAPAPLPMTSPLVPPAPILSAPPPAPVMSAPPVAAPPVPAASFALPSPTPLPAPKPVTEPPPTRQEGSLPAHAPRAEEPAAFWQTSQTNTPAPAPRAYDLGSELALEMADLAAPLEEELPPQVISAGEMASLRSMLAELIDPANRDTVTLLVLRYASQLVERAGLFLATRRAFVGLGGFSASEESDKFVLRVRKIQIPVDFDSVFSRVAKFRTMVRGPLKETEGNKRLIDGMGGQWPGDNTVAAPLISGDRVAAILYGDNPSGKPLTSTDSLEIFLQQAGLAMDRALLERKLEDTRKKHGGSE